MEEIVIQEIKPFNHIEAIFYASAWLLSGFAGVGRALYDNEYRNGRHLFGISIVSGFLGTTASALLFYFYFSDGGNEFLLILAGAMVGLIGKEVFTALTSLVKPFIIFQVKRILKVDLNEIEQKEEETNT